MSNDHAHIHESQGGAAPADQCAEPGLPGIGPPESAVVLLPGIDAEEVKRALEAVLMAASEPIALNELKRLFDGEISPETLKALLDQLREESNGRSVELALVASGYRYRVRPQYQRYLDILANEKPPKYSRAVLETLAIIAYRQPVTRGDMEDIRGVTINSVLLKQLEDRGWVEVIGHREAPGRPALYATTRQFLDDLGLQSLDQLPLLADPMGAVEAASALADTASPFLAELENPVAADEAQEPPTPDTAEPDSDSLFTAHEP